MERLYLSVRTHLRRLRPQNERAHRGKLANHKACVALWVAWYNFVRVNTSVRITPCMAAEITSAIWTMQELLEARGENKNKDTLASHEQG